MLIISLSIIDPSFAVYCDLCSGGEQPRDPSAKFKYFSNKLNQEQIVSCKDASLMANNKVFSNCTQLHQRTKIYCGCDGNNSLERQCSLCKHDMLPNPSKVVAGKTCGNWENEANKDFIDDCGVYQYTYGYHCGCDVENDALEKDDTLENEVHENFCYICGNKTLPDPDKKIQYVNGKEEYCVEAEQKMNVRTNLNCSKMQSEYSDACSCNVIKPKIQTNRGNIIQINAQIYWISFMFVVVIIV